MNFYLLADMMVLNWMMLHDMVYSNELLTQSVSQSISSNLMICGSPPSFPSSMRQFILEMKD